MKEEVYEYLLGKPIKLVSLKKDILRYKFNKGKINNKTIFVDYKIDSKQNNFCVSQIFLEEEETIVDVFEDKNSYVIKVNIYENN